MTSTSLTTVANDYYHGVPESHSGEVTELNEVALSEEPLTKCTSEARSIERPVVLLNRYADVSNSETVSLSGVSFDTE